VKIARRLALALMLVVAFSASPSATPVPSARAAGLSIPPRIDHNAKTITFDVKLFLYPQCPYFFCEVTDAIVAQIASNIEAAWNNGLKFECYTVVLNFQIRKGQQWELRPDEVGIKINRLAANITSETATDHGSRWNASDPSDRGNPLNDGSTWGSPPMNEGSYAHEMGHVLGLDDGYRTVNNVAEDIPGAPHDVMSTGVFDSVSVSQQTVDVLIHRAGITKDDLRCDTGWRIHIAWTDSYDGIFDTITFDGIIDTVPPDQPPSEQIYMTGIGTATGSRNGWKKCNPGIDITPNGSGPATFQAFVSKDTVSFSAFANIDTPLAGVSTALFVVPLDGGTFDVPQNAPVGDPCPHYSFGTGQATPFQPDSSP
jgi:hypothetical protein